MQTIQEILKRLEDRNLRAVAERSGVNYMTLYRIAKGDTKDPSYSIVKRLHDYLEANP